MGKRSMPVGTMRQWEAGEFIKAHENSIFSSGWIPVVTNEKLLSLSSKLDSLASKIKLFKTPIEGELFLDHEIEEFEKDENGNHPFNPHDFKKYEGFYGAGRYSFKNELNRRFMSKKINIASDVNDALLNENGDGDKIVLSDERRKGIRKSVKDRFKDDKDNFDIIKQAEKLLSIVERTYAQLEKGTDFDDPKQKELYTQVMEAVKSIPASYERISIKRALKNDLIERLDVLFKDNWGVRETVKKLLINAYSEYVRYYAEQISHDEAKDQEALFGVKLDAPVDEFYKAINEKLKSEGEKKKVDYSRLNGLKFNYNGNRIEVSANKDKITFDVYDSDGVGIFITKEDDVDDFEEIFNYMKETNSTIFKYAVKEGESKYPFKELIYLRFETLYGKQLDGDWKEDMLPAIYNIEKLMNQLPNGHFKTNTDLRLITNRDLNGSEGYAYFDPSDSRINFSNKAANSFQIYGDLKGSLEFKSVLSHEIGHACSYKLGKANYLDYKKFVVACGWSYQQFEWEDKQFHATGSDPDIRREGSNGDIPLLTKYAHKSPEEAFAEYYSIYTLHKKEIDHWLDTNDASSLMKESLLVAPELKESDLPKLERYWTGERNEYNEVSTYADTLNRDLNDHIRMELVNPWHVTYSKAEEQFVKNAEFIKKGLFYAREKFVKPAVFIKRGVKDYLCIAEGKISHACRYTKKFCPGITVSEEVYKAFREKGFSNGMIINYLVERLNGQEARVPVQESSPVFKKGLPYRLDILEAKDVVHQRARFEAMRKIYGSERLAKAILELFAPNDIESIFVNNVSVDKEQDETILKAKVDVLLNNIQDSIQIKIGNNGNERM